MNVQEVAAQYGEYLIEKRRYFHQHPEVSTKEYHTSKAIKEALDEIGVSWRPCGLETGVLGHHSRRKARQDHFASRRYGCLDGSGNHRGALCRAQTRALCMPAAMTAILRCS